METGRIPAGVGPVSDCRCGSPAVMRLKAAGHGHRYPPGWTAVCPSCACMEVRVIDGAGGVPVGDYLSGGIGSVPSQEGGGHD